MAITNESVSYQSADGTSVPAYIARPEGDGPFPAVLMCYEIFGMAETPEGAQHMREVASRFVDQGYVAIIPDVFTARDEFPRVENGTIVGAPSDAEFETDLTAGIRYLQEQPYVRSDRVGVIGWCGGGRQAFFMAARSADVKAAVGFYGRPVNRAATERQPVSPIDLIPQMNCPIFGAFGEADPGIPVALVHDFEVALERAGKTHEIHVYSGAPHGFMNDQRESYRELAAKDAWRRALRFFDQHLKET
jgi:carboxymethylenebutenolidase